MRPTEMRVVAYPVILHAFNASDRARQCCSVYDTTLSTAWDFFECCSGASYATVLPVCNCTARRCAGNVVSLAMFSAGDAAEYVAADHTDRLGSADNVSSCSFWFSAGNAAGAFLRATRHVVGDEDIILTCVRLRLPQHCIY